MRTMLFLVLLLSGFSGWSQPTLNELLGTAGSSQEEKDVAYLRVRALIASIKQDQKNDQKTLQRLFHKVHKTLLKRYEAYADFRRLFADGTYDCLSATTLFSHLLTELKYDFQVVETNYHIFMLVQTSRGQVMLETTDRLSGFVTDSDVIASRTGDYRKNKLAAANNDRMLYQYTFSLYQEVSLEKLTGLLLYNQAVRAYNQGDWLSSARSLERAHAIYATPRCEALGDILVRTVLETNTPALIRQECISRLEPVLMARAGTMASNQ